MVPTAAPSGVARGRASVSNSRSHNPQRTRIVRATAHPMYRGAPRIAAWHTCSEAHPRMRMSVCMRPCIRLRAVERETPVCRTRTCLPRPLLSMSSNLPDANNCSVAVLSTVVGAVLRKHDGMRRTKTTTLHAAEHSTWWCARRVRTASFTRNGAIVSLARHRCNGRRLITTI